MLALRLSNLEPSQSMGAVVAGAGAVTASMGAVVASAGAETAPLLGPEADLAKCTC